MKWSLAAAKDGFFITSDNPVIKFVDPASVHPIYGSHGLMHKSVEVSFALSPTVLLVLSHQENPVPALPRSSATTLTSGINDEPILRSDTSTPA